MDKIKIDNELPRLGVQTAGEIPKIEFKADGEPPLISLDEQAEQAYRTLRRIEEADKKRIARNQFKHDLFIAIISATVSAILTNIDRIIRSVMELIPLLANFLLRQ